MSEVKDELAIEVEKAIALENGVINWDYWLALIQCELWYLIALSCGFDPFRLEFMNVPMHQRLTPTYYKPSDPAHILDTITSPINMVPNHIRFIGIPKNKEKMFGIRMEVALQDLEALLPPPITDKVYYLHRQKFDVRKFVKWIKTKRTWAVPTELLNILKKNTKVTKKINSLIDVTPEIATHLMSQHGVKMSNSRHRVNRENRKEVLARYHKDFDKYKDKTHASKKITESMNLYLTQKIKQSRVYIWICQDTKK